MTRVYYLLFYISPWQKVYDTLDKRDYINRENVEALRPFVEISLLGMTILGVIIDIAAFKYRKLANVLIYYEIVMNIIHALIPYNYGDFEQPFLLAKIVITLISYSCDPRFDIFVVTFGQAVIEIFAIPAVHQE